MAEIKKLPGDLPENWQLNQAVTPNGSEAGLDEKHGYNYLMKQVNDAHAAVNELDQNKVEKVAGKALSTFDFNAAEKANIEKKADKTALAATDKALGQLQMRVDNIEVFVIDFTLLATGWSPTKTYNLQEPRLTSTTEGELVEGNNTDEEHMALAKACISRETVVSTGQLVIIARGTVPTMDVKVKLKVRKF